MAADEEFTEEAATPPPAEEGAPIWMVTFGDMMSLLLTFFILLFSMSELKMDRFLMASQSLREAIGGTAADPIDDPMGLMPDPVDPELQLQNPGMAEAAEPEGADSGDGDRSISERLADQYLDRIADTLTAFISENDLETTLLVSRGPTGVRLRIKASALFPSGEGEVVASSEWIINFIAELTSGLHVPVVVAGHADNQPIRTEQFASNWELSAVRAAGVARSLVSDGHDPEQIRVESFGEHVPIASNETPEGRAENRRVEFFYDRRDLIETIEGWRSDLSGADETADGTAAETAEETAAG
jgi:chemotaxis protein MotB